MAYTFALLRDILEWDVANWKHALFFWDRFCGDISGKRVLDLGARHGGLSLHFALKGCQVLSTDLHGPSEQARQLHQRYGVADRVCYGSIDAAAIDQPDESFDIVCFKSVLGIVGRNDSLANQRRAVCEMHRVLKPGGLLLFAENLTASPLHQLLRRRYVSWSSAWRYVRCSELSDMLAIFSHVEMDTYGFFAVFGRSEFQRRCLHWLDVLLGPLVPGVS